MWEEKGDDKSSTKVKKWSHPSGNRHSYFRIRIVYILENIFFYLIVILSYMFDQVMT